jgi:hypothetical protein
MCAVAEAKKSISLPPCPSEGWTFEEALRHAAGAKLWKTLKQALDDEARIRRAAHSSGPWGERRDAAFQACARPLVALLKTGIVILKGCRGDPLAPHIEFPASKQRYLSYDPADLSVLRLRTGETIFDVRVWTKSAEQEALASGNDDYETVAFKKLTPRVQLAVKVIDALEAEGKVLTGIPFRPLLALVLEKA